MTTRCPAARVLAFLVLALAAACAGPPVSVSPERFQANIAWLADDARAGRQTGTPQAEETARYVLTAFDRAGLRPLPGRGWYQDFEAAGDRVLGKANHLAFDGEAQRLGTDFMVLPSALSGTVEASMVFAGYGVSDPERKYDDYADLDVTDKLVVVLRQGPGASLAEDAPLRKRYAAGVGRQHISLIRKINTAFKHGAAGLLIVNDPASRPIGSEKDTVGEFKKGGLGGVASSLPSAIVSAEAGASLLGKVSQDLTALQASIDGSGRPHSFSFDSVNVNLQVESSREMVAARNVIGFLEGSDPDLRHEHVVVGAHMDHVGLGHHGGSLDNSLGEIHNGADDNASGTSGLIEIARALGGLEERPARSVIFMAFGAEEWGLLGSRHYCNEPWLPLEDCVAMVNMDMIGRSGGELTVQGLGSAKGLRSLVETLNGDFGLELDLGDDVPSNTDHAPFYEKGIPVLSFFTGLHDDYHRPGDDIEKIDAENGAAVAGMAGSAAYLLADTNVRFGFTKYVPPAKPATSADPHDGQEVIGYGVSFGSRPDMTYSGDDGVRISGVRAASPAEKCGLTEGDIIISLDGKPVRNLEDYSILLFSHRPGDEIEVGIKRGAETLVLKAILEGKSGEN